MIRTTKSEMKNLVKRFLADTLTDLGPLEGDYRVAHLKADISQSILYMSIISVSTLLMLGMDAMFFRSDPGRFLLVALFRVGYVLATILVGRVLKRTTRVRDYDHLAFGWILLTILFVLLINFTRPANYLSASFDVVVPFVVYLLSPLKIRQTFPLAAGYSLGMLYIAFFRNFEFDPIILNAAVFTQVIVHVLGISFSLQLQSYRRKSYQAFIDEKDAKEMVAYLANIDPLTKSLTRRQFMNIAESEFRRFTRYRRPLSLLILDADGFKQINDTYGHHVGDVVLRSLSLVAMEQKRAQDTFGRLGGEEFGLLMPETTLENAALVAERIRHTWEVSPVNLDGRLIHSTISIGVAEAALTDQSLEDLLRRADRMLYKAKEAGRNRVES
ncbi:MAG: GGDEF domain-containing protein [Chloroflexi bacterium]|nr:GGDEF domain-containing protein [Chloroflexota bacterium]